MFENFLRKISAIVKLQVYTNSSVKIQLGHTYFWSIYFRVKSALMQIWKSLYMFVFILKEYPEKCAFLILRILE